MCALVGFERGVGNGFLMDFARELHITIKEHYVLGTQEEYRAAGYMPITIPRHEQNSNGAIII